MSTNDVRQDEILRATARELAAKLKIAYQEIDVWQKPSQLAMTPTAFGPVSYTGYREMVEVGLRDAAGNRSTVDKVTRYSLIGVLAGGAPEETIDRFSKLLRMTARLLGAPDDDLLLTLRNDGENAKAAPAGKIVDSNFRTRHPMCVNVNWPAIE